jgi:hypothetical protein
MFDIADTIHKGREYIERHGWLSGQLADNSSETVCGYGAILAGLEWLDWDEEAIDDEHSGREEELFPVMEHLVTKGAGLELRGDINPTTQWVSWNDEEGRTEQEVLDAFAKAEKVALAGFDPDQGVTP